MDVTRSRTCWTSCAIVSLVVCSALTYSMCKVTTGFRPNWNNTSNYSVPKSTTEWTNPLITTIITPQSTEIKTTTTTVPETTTELINALSTTTSMPENTSEMYSPLTTTPSNPEYNFNWSDFRTHGALSARVVDFQGNGDCTREVKFFGQGELVEILDDDCDSLEPSMGLLMVDNMLYYFEKAVLIEEPTERTFTVVKKIDKGTCNVTTKTVKGDNSTNFEVVSKSKVVKAVFDNACKKLVDFKIPPMLLLSTNGKIGTFLPEYKEGWINRWKPLGIRAQVYTNGVSCFRLLIITSYGRLLKTVKVSCGPMENLVVTDIDLYYSDALLVRRYPIIERFFIIYNPKRSGNCVMEHIAKNSNIRISRETEKAYTEFECKNLINGRIDDSTVNKDELSGLMNKLNSILFVNEYKSLSSNNYVKYSRNWSTINLPMDLGLAITFYEECNMGKKTQGKLVVVVARGVAVAFAMVDPEQIERVVIRNNVLYYDKDIMLMKIDDDKFVSLSNANEEDKCHKKSHIFTYKSGNRVKEDKLSGRVKKSKDILCKDLLEGNKLKKKNSCSYTLTDAETDDRTGQWLC